MPKKININWAVLSALTASIVVAQLTGAPRIAAAASADDATGPILLARAVTDPALDSQRFGSSRDSYSLPDLLPGPSIDPWVKKGAAPKKKIRQSDAALRTKIALWVKLKDSKSEASFAEITAFMDANPDWPMSSRMQILAEKAISKETAPTRILDWFSRHAPRTAGGATAYADALAGSGNNDEAVKVLRHAWTNFYMDSSTERKFLARYGKSIDSADHWARLDRLLWNRRISASRRQMKRVSGDRSLLAAARLSLMQRRRNADAAVRRVPDWLRDDAGLAYERLRWRRRKDMDQEAREILRSPPADVVRPGLWWKERQVLARRLLSDGEPEIAYRLVQDHGLKDSIERTEAEFLAGWIALRFADNSEAAFRHFSDLHNSVRYPISRARAAYWAGRAAEESGFTEIAESWYRTAAAHVTTFYGQLAARRMDTPDEPSIPLEPEISAEAAAAFDEDELVRATRMLIAMRSLEPMSAKDLRRAKKAGTPIDPIEALAGLDDRKALVQMLRHIVRRAEEPEDWVLAGRLAREAGREEIAVYAAKRASRAGTVLGDLGYPTIVITDGTPPGSALVHALVRQESEFDPGARSRVGARGLMQLMPATARNVARQLKVRGHSTERLTSDPIHNVRLGSAYLDEMLEKFDGSMIMALAAYNAGPHRVTRWISENGDPRGSLDRSIDWIESIPISETRNYVQRVLETVPIYRWKLQGGDVAVLQVEDVAGRPPSARRGETR